MKIYWEGGRERGREGGREGNDSVAMKKLQAVSCVNHVFIGRDKGGRERGREGGREGGRRGRERKSKWMCFVLSCILRSKQFTIGKKKVIAKDYDSTN